MFKIQFQRLNHIWLPVTLETLRVNISSSVSYWKSLLYLLKIRWKISSRLSVASQPDDDDHVEWLLENEQFIEALEFTKNRKLAKHSYNVIGRDYIRFLIEDDQMILAAQKCQKFLFTSDEWEREALAFSSKGLGVKFKIYHNQILI